jgi:hypothetical protein
MGWFFGYSNRKSLIAELIENQEQEKDGILWKQTCIKHCYRGCAWSGVLWSVFEDEKFQNGIQIHSDRWIRCDVLQYIKGDWGYKPLCEEMGPCYYSVPLSYLEMTTVVNPEWRQLVMENYQEKRNKRNKKKISTLVG